MNFTKSKERMMNLLLMLLFLLAGSVLCGAALPSQNNSLSIKERVRELLGKMTLDEKIDMIGGYKNFNIKPLERLGIPEIHMADGPVGVRNYGESTAYASSIGLAASFNTNLAERVGASIGREAKAKNVHIMLGPAMNIHRAPMCGRNFEYLGEDPFLAGEIASHYIIGMQNEGVMATAKHYAANYQDYDRHRVSSDMDERTLREIYLPAFKACVQKGRVASVMTAYNLVNGVHCSEDKKLNIDILKNEWEFDGFVMSDWTSTYDAVSAANGGLDLEMPWAEFMNKETLLSAIQKGIVSESTIDDKVARILYKMIEFGYLDHPDISRGFAVNEQDCRDMALEQARESIVLLKNEHLLPLDPSKVKILAVLGPNADPAVTGGGGSSKVEPANAVSLKQGIEDLAGKEMKILYAPGPFEHIAGEFFQENHDFYTEIDGQKIPGLKAEIFDHMECSGEPVMIRVDPVIDFTFGTHIGDLLCQQIAIRWTGKIRVEESGEYKFVCAGDDGYRLYINGQLEIDEWQDQAEKTTHTVIRLEAGREYDVKIEYYQNGGGASFRFGYQKLDLESGNEAYDYAKEADAVIVAIGFNHATESESFDRTFALPREQEIFLNKVLGLNPNTIVVLFAGGNVDMQSWLPKTKALIHAFYPGQEGGRALAEIIFGQTNPSAKLPVSFEKKWEDNPTANSYFDEDGDKKVFFAEGVFLGYRYYDTKNVEPQFPFGFGLSYTTFDYSNLDVIQHEDSTLTVRLDVQNTGDVFGKEIVQVYVSDKECSIDRPVKELKGFGKIALEPGEKKTLKIAIPKEAFAFFSEAEHKWIIEPGEFDILVGASSRDIRLKTTITL